MVADVETMGQTPERSGTPVALYPGEAHEGATHGRGRRSETGFTNDRVESSFQLWMRSGAPLSYPASALSDAPPAGAEPDGDDEADLCRRSSRTDPTARVYGPEAGQAAQGVRTGRVRVALNALSRDMAGSVTSVTKAERRGEQSRNLKHGEQAQTW